MNTPHVRRSLARRAFIRRAAAGTVITAMGGGLYYLADDLLMGKAQAMTRADGRPRLPPGQRLIKALKPMGGVPGSPSPSDFRLRVHGEVRRPFELDFKELLAMPQTQLAVDVHCVTTWSMFDAEFKGVRVSELAERAGVKDSAHHVIFEAAHGYTANVLIEEALAPDVLVAHRHAGRPLARPHGAPVRAVVPSLYFWKSPKWLTGIRFVHRDEPGYWEVRGYNNHADPWLEERYS
ncbi:MAG: molybdopterin-dependent oxidoreductase [Myxococcales bacterium]|nr:molybdopterin-dependent oxidoreductase [Myxococcales bacterium]MCB9755537.1 molybdopterin-dependent oxidoreductase [Myxococcales bacterium]